MLLLGACKFVFVPGWELPLQYSLAQALKYEVTWLADSKYLTANKSSKMHFSPREIVGNKNPSVTKLQLLQLAQLLC